MRPVFPFSEEIILENERVRLRPLTAEDLDDLLPYIRNEQELFQYGLQPMKSKQDLESYILFALKQRAQGLEYPFAVYDKNSGKLAGTTRYYLINTTHSWLAIGYTWIGSEYQGTGLNRSMKQLLLEFAFKQLNFERVEFRVDKENLKSINALTSIGAIYEGELRNHMYRADGSRRNTLIFSIIQEEFDREWT